MSRTHGAIRFGCVLFAAWGISLHPAVMQSPAQRPAKIKSCPVADSLLGRMGSDWEGKVRGFYDPKGDSTMLWSGAFLHNEDEPWWPTALVWFHGNAIVEYPVAVFTVLLQGSRARPIIDAAQGPVVSMVLDDSLILTLGRANRGAYTGPRGRVVAPVNVRLTDLQFLGLARAKRVKVRVGNDELQLNGQDRRDIRALYRLAVCHVPVQFEALEDNR